MRMKRRTKQKGSHKMSSTAAERRQVFLACKGKAIFSGPYASYRNTGAIIKRIVKHKTSLRALFPKFSVGRVCRVSKELLEAGVFESDIKAQLIFPDLLAPSTTKEREHNAFEDEAAHTQAKTVKEADSVCEEEESEIKQSPSISMSMKVETSVEEETHANQEYTSGTYNTLFCYRSLFTFLQYPCPHPQLSRSCPFRHYTHRTSHTMLSILSCHKSSKYWRKDVLTLQRNGCLQNLKTTDGIAPQR